MSGPLSVELSVDLTQEEVTAYREANAKGNEDWRAAAIVFFASLRERRSRYQVRQIAKGYNAVV